MRRRGVSGVGAALLAMISPAALAQTTSVAFDGADPDIEVVDGGYAIYPTGGSGLSVWRSTDLVRWEKGATLLRKADIGWIADDRAPRHSLWAPDMVAANGRHYFYYSVGPQNPTPSRLGVAVCEGPFGPCTDSGKPLVTGGNGFEAIDPAVFLDPRSGTRYLYAGGSAGATLRVWVLNPDMVSIAREVKVETPPHFTEAAFMHERDGVYYLSYSSGSWQRSSYQVHYATARSPIGPWRYAGRILESDETFKGPGHHALVRDPKTGGWSIAYHRWEGQSGEGPYRGSRRVVVQPIHYRADGSIVPVTMR